MNIFQNLILDKTIEFCFKKTFLEFSGIISKITLLSALDFHKTKIVLINDKIVSCD